MNSNRTNRSRVILAILFGAATLASAYAVSNYVSQFQAAYPAAASSGLASCTLYHTSVPALNSYGSAYAGTHSFSAIANLDSDGDAFSNIQEINALTFPGNAGSKPSPPADTTAPTVTVFSIPATSSSLTVPITSFTATDSVGVTGYMVTEAPGAPAAGASGWSASPPAGYTFAGAGAKTLYAWAKDAAGNVSASRSASTMISLPPAGDITAPTVTAFSIPATSSSLTVPVTSLAASDNIGVTGYMITESSSAPAAAAAGWSASPPASYTFAGAGAKRLYAWAKDAAGNVSASGSASTTITLPPAGDTAAPTVTTFSLPASSSSLTVPITSLTASDDVGIAGYLVTETSTKPAASAPEWKPTPPTSHTFSSAGAKTLYGWAKDAAGNVSNSRNAQTTITLPGDSTSDMNLWVGQWFRVKIKREAERESWKDVDDDSDDESGEIGYLKVRSWDSQQQVLQASLFYRDRRTGPWESTNLPLRFTVGTPQRFLFWFEYAGEFQFAAGMIARVDRGVLMKASFSAAGIYLLKSEDEMDDDVNIALIISGNLVPEWRVPQDLPKSQ